MEPDITRGRDNSLELDLEVVEAAFTEVWARWERVLEELGGSVPASQLRAVLVIDASGAVPVPRLAGALGMSSSGAARLCDQLEGAGLGAWELDGGSGQESSLAITPAGQRLASWVRISAVPTLPAAWIDEPTGPPGPDPRAGGTSSCAELTDRRGRGTA